MMISLSNVKLKLAPMVKKNRIKKKSLRGFRLIAMYCAIGLFARLIPAIKAPISKES